MYNYNGNDLYHQKIDNVNSLYQEQTIPYWKERYFINEDTLRQNVLNKNEDFRDSSFNSKPNLTQRNQRDIIHEIELKNAEIVKLNLKVQELEKIRNGMLIDLEGYENEFAIVEKKFISKENELNDKLQICELEKQNLQMRLDYYQKLYPGITNNVNFDQGNDMFRIIENKKLKEEIKLLNEKLGMLTGFYNDMQNIVLKKNTNINVLHSLDNLSLKYRLNEVVEETKSLLNRLDKINLEMNYNQEQTSEKKEKAKTDLVTNLLKNNLIDNKKKTNNYSPNKSSDFSKKKKFFAPPPIKDNTIDSILIDNIITENNKENNESNHNKEIKTNISSTPFKNSLIKDDIKPKLSLKNMPEKTEETNKKTEKLIETVQLLTDKINKIDEYILKHSMDKEKQIQKTENSNINTNSRASNTTSQRDFNKQSSVGNSIKRKPSIRAQK